MTVVKTIELTGAEENILEDALHIINEISSASNKTMVEVFDYILENARVFDLNKWHVDSFINIDAI